MNIDPEKWHSDRRYLLAVAYRLLGSVADAEDAVGEAYLRLRRESLTDVADVRAWLTTVVSRIALDQLRSARTRRESYVGTWLPEPLVGENAQPDPGDRVTVVESVQTAMLIVLESLSPAERTAFVLHDVFGMNFEEIGEVVGRSAAACRQLAARARKHVHSRSPRFDVDPVQRGRVVAAFLVAARRGDLDGLVQLLDPGVVYRGDGGGVAPAALWPVHGAKNVARLLLGLGAHYGDTILRLTPVGGGPGIVMYRDGALLAAAAVTVDEDRITAVDVVTNPDKLHHVRVMEAWD